PENPARSVPAQDDRGVVTAALDLWVLLQSNVCTCKSVRFVIIPPRGVPEMETLGHPETPSLRWRRGCLLARHLEMCQPPAFGPAVVHPLLSRADPCLARRQAGTWFRY